MSTEEKNILVQNYINKIVSDVNSKYENLISNELKERAIKNYTNSNKSYEEIQEEINKIVHDMIEKYLKKLEFRKELAKKKEEKTANKKIFGQTYKSILIELFQELDDLEDNKDLDYITKKELFEKKLSEYLSKSKTDYEEFLKKRTDSKELIEYGLKELYLGYDSLDYDTVKKLKDIFTNDVNMVQCEAEGKLKMTLTADQQIFDSKGNINSNLEFDFSKIKIIYDYAKKEEKMIKHHELLWHNSVPESLKKEISAIDSLNISEEQKKSIKRDMCLKFMDYYYSKLAEFFKKNNYDIRQIDVLNEIANDKLEGGILRESFWSINIGDNPINGDKYFIDVLRLAKKHFPDIELIYNDYNEFIDYKCDRMCSIVEYIRKIEERDGMKLLDGLGLQSHYRDFVPELGRKLQPEDIIKTALKFIKLGIPIYISEWDFNNEKNSDISELIQTFVEVYSVAANGFNAWGNTDKLTWGHCLSENGEFLNSHVIDSKGDKKEIFYKIQNYFYGLTPETLSQMQESLNASAKKYLEIIKHEYGSYMTPEQLAFMEKLESQSLIKVEDNPFAYLEMKRKEILENPNLSDIEKKEQLLKLTAPLAHGGRVYGDDVIHFYPSVLINPNEPLTLEQIQSKCDSLVVHELLHYFIRPEYMDISNTPELKGINGFTGEGLVDMCARDIHLKYGIHAEDYDSNYTTNVVFMREALSHISDPTERMKTIFTNSVEEVYSKTTTENYDSKKEYEKTVKKDTSFQKTISEISKLMPEHQSALEHKLMEIAANSESKEKAIETIQTMGSPEQNQAIKNIVEKNNVEKTEAPKETIVSDTPEPKKIEFKTAKEKKVERKQAQSNFGEMSPKKQEVYKQQKETTKANNETKTVDKPKTLTLNKPSNPNNSNSSNGSSNSGGFVNMAFMISIIILTSIAAVLFAYHLISGWLNELWNIKRTI